MARRRLTLRPGSARRVVYSSRRAAERARERAPGTQRIRRVKAGWVVENAR